MACCWCRRQQQPVGRRLVWRRRLQQFISQTDEEQTWNISQISDQHPQGVALPESRRAFVLLLSMEQLQWVQRGGGDSCMSSSHYSWNLQLIANHVYQFNIKGSNGITLQHFISKFSDKWQLPQTSLLECTPTVECSPVVVPYVRTCFYNNYFTFRISCMNCIEYKKFFLSKYNSTFDC